MNLAEQIFQRAETAAVAVIETDTAYSFAELDRLSAAIAQKLGHQSGGSRLGLRGKDGMAYIATALGILRSGACLVPLAPELTETERQALTRTMALKGILNVRDGGDFSNDPIEPHPEPVEEHNLASLNPAFIRFSSGTTGKSKGILLSHESLRERVEAANAGLQIAPGDRVLWVLSMSHHFAVSIMLYLWHGATIVLPTTHLAGDILGAAQKHGATVLYGAPPHYMQLATGEQDTPWPTLRLAVSTTAGLKTADAEAFAKKFGVYPAQALGIMEVGLPLLNVPEPQKRPESVGRAQPAFQVEVRKDGKALPAGQPGELHLKGPGMFDAYTCPWQNRDQVLTQDGWFCTGDIAKLDADGFVYLLGRSSAVINVGGMKFFPEEVEALLCSHPGVREARVLGIPHPSFGVVPVAEVVKSGDPDVSTPELASFCRKRLARYKLPVEFRYLDRIPKTATGKLKRV